MSKHHKHKKYKNNYIDEGMVNQNPFMPPQNNIMQNNQVPFMMQNTNDNMMSNGMPNAPLKSLFPNSFNNNPILSLLGNIDINLLAKLLLNHNSKTSDNTNEQKYNQDSLQDLFKNIDGNQVQDLLKNVDENQINSLLNMFKNNSGQKEEIIQNGYENDNSIVEVYQNKYKAADIINVIYALLDQNNIEFLDKVMEIYQESYVLQPEE